MALQCIATRIPEVVVLCPDVFRDTRGFFMETYHRRKYESSGVPTEFVQDNYSHSCRDTLRGLHFQMKHPQQKLVSVIWGTIFDVAVDIRIGSSTFGQWVGQTLSDENRRQLYIPEGFAHGFCVLSETADVMYKCSDYYDPQDDQGVLWSDTDIAVAWPVETPLLSAKDSRNPPLSEIPRAKLPEYSPPRM